MPPFDGATIFTAQTVKLPILLRLVAPIVDVLYAYDNAQALFTMADWHEHDGYVSPSYASRWQDLLTACASAEALKAACMEETYVRRTYFPGSRSWILRIYVPEPDDNLYFDHDDPNLIDCGVFDLTGSDDLIQDVKRTLDTTALPYIGLARAKAHFDSSAA